MNESEGGKKDDTLQLPRERDLEFLILAGNVFWDLDFPHYLNGLPVEHFTVPETKKVFSYVVACSDYGKEWFSSDPPFKSFEVHMADGLMIPHQQRECKSRLEETRELREAYIEATTTMRATGKKDITAIRDICGMDKPLEVINSELPQPCNSKQVEASLTEYNPPTRSLISDKTNLVGLRR